MRRTFALLFCAAVFAVMATTANAAPAEEPTQTVLIGVVGPLTIPRGESTRDAAQFAVDRINAQGLRIGDRNTRLRLFLADDKNDLNLAVISARAAVAAGVIGVVGHLTTDASIAAARIYNEAGVPQLSPTAAGREFTQLGYSTVFQMLGHSEYTTQYLAEAAVKVLRAKRIMLIDNDTLLGKALARGFTAAVARQGGQIVDIEKINAKSSDFNTVIAKINGNNVDLVFFAGVAPQTNAFAVRLRQLGLQTRLLLAGGAINPLFPRKTEEYPEGTLVLVNGNPVEKVPNFKRLEQAYREKYTSPLIPQTWFAYDAVEMMVEAMKRAGSTNPRLLSPILHQMKFNGLSGTISFTADGSLTAPQYTLYRAEQGSWKTLNTLP
jgi:branched-chain amino acid transport system substrate-binding protein